MQCEIVSSTVHPRLQGGDHAPITEHCACPTDTHGMAFIVTDDVVSVEHAETKHHHCALLLGYKTDSGRHHIQSYFFHTIIAMVKFLGIYGHSAIMERSYMQFQGNIALNFVAHRHVQMHHRF